ncbi:ATP-dependent helicase HrpB [Rhodospirillaceae bacterium SYSU D60014]|uniref:ATP-dependent helicase HrpB n=1 Tax=Virgifigura deserti TaxID=2268457 RepID=UPI000E66F4C0
MTPLPIDSVLPDLLGALARSRSAVLQAPPGAGKTTRVPLALLGADWLGDRRVLVLEPRRLAARAVARRMASTLGEAVGETVGYSMRMDSRTGPRTRIEVVTEGVLTRRLQRDPALEGVGAVLFDEFHERSLQADLGLALCLEVKGALRDDLRLLVMSATLDGDPIARLLCGAPVITTHGRSFSVETRYLDREPQGLIERTVAAVVARALAEETGSILVFLPGEAEIRRVQALLEEADLDPDLRVEPLYGALPQDRQDEAIRPAPPGRRKVVLATAIAETSLTIEGIRVVIDAGLMRVPRFDPRSGMTRLETVRVSQASAEQRRGRAGRLEPGVCYRLWTKAGQGALLPFGQPEIAEADLAPLALDLAQWGAGDPGDLAWLDPPPAAAFAQARDLLTGLGALDGQGRITAHGREMLSLGLHPRLAHMILKGRERGLGALACDLAALLGERDILQSRRGERDTDLRLRLDLLHAARRGQSRPEGVHRGALDRALQAARAWCKQTGCRDGDHDRDQAGLLLSLAYPDRIARRRAKSGGAFLLSNGRGAVLPETDPLSASDWLAVAALDGARRNAAIFLAAPLSQSDIEEIFEEQIRWDERIEWDAQAQGVKARREQRLGALVLRDEPLPDPDPARLAAALLQGVRQVGLDALPWTRDLRDWCARVLFLRGVDEGAAWPDLSVQALLDSLEAWLEPYLLGLSRLSDLKRLDLAGILQSRLDWEQRRRLDQMAPVQITVPSGSRIRVDYGAGEVPVLAVRLQEMFGATETPTIANGRVPVLLHLLSPAGRPVQVTRDLAGFWADGYRQVKADLKGRYPKHAWPEDPLTAEPTSRAKRRSA